MDKPKRKRGGRARGSKNKSTLIGKNIQETLRNWIGLDDASVVRTGMIAALGRAGGSAPGARGRHDQGEGETTSRPPDPVGRCR